MERRSGMLFEKHFMSKEMTVEAKEAISEHVAQWSCELKALNFPWTGSLYFARDVEHNNSSNDLNEFVEDNRNKNYRIGPIAYML